MAEMIGAESHLAAHAPLRDLARGRNKLIGAAVAVSPLADEERYREILAREFNLVTPENAMKFGPIHPGPEEYDFSGADAIVSFAKTHGMMVRGHTLVWHNQLPDWITNGTYSRDQLAAILREHIHTVVGRYRGNVRFWDVVNEGLTDDGRLRETVWSRVIGPEYLALAFQWAHEADPSALLFYNDYNGEGLNVKSDGIYQMVRSLRDDGVPIHGVGLQMHVGLRNHPRPCDVLANQERLTALGLETQITEMDVQIQKAPGSIAERLKEQARIYHDTLALCLAAPRCTAFVTWGFTDRHSWIPHFTHHRDQPLLFDDAYQPKPAYEALRAAFLEE